MAEDLRRIVLGDVLSPPSRERFTGWMLEQFLRLPQTKPSPFGENFALARASGDRRT